MCYGGPIWLVDQIDLLASILIIDIIHSSWSVIDAKFFKAEVPVLILVDIECHVILVVPCPSEGIRPSIESLVHHFEYVMFYIFWVRI